MAQTRAIRCWKLFAASFLCVGGAFPTNSTLAQITPDSTLPVNSTVTPQGNIRLIEGGTVAGGNLFHSFQEFSIPTGGEAFFNNAAGIKNIISRVTGGSVSTIDGLIRANGVANLFLLNPNGILFGPNARLNLGGSFLGSTASSLRFADGTEFSAVAPQTTSLLTISVPIGLQFRGVAGNILNQSRAAADNGDLVGFQVQPGRSLALVGGNVSVDGGILLAPGGRVELGGLVGSGTVGLNVDGNNLSLSFPSGVTRADVLLTNRANVNVVAGDGGSIAINAGNLDVLKGSVIEAGIAQDLGSVGSQVGDITINASETIEIASSFIVNILDAGAVGQGGNINIQAGSFSLRDGAQVSTSTFSEGSGGNLTVNASESVNLIGTSVDGQFSSSLLAQTYGAGAGGNLTIATRQLLVQKGAEISTSPFSNGQGGNLTANATESVELTGASGQRSSGLFVRPQGSGAAGDLTIITGKLIIQNGAQVSTSPFSSGQGGNLTVNATESVELMGNPDPNGPPSGLFTITLGTGNAGKLTITTGRLIVRNGAQVGAGSGSRGGRGGDFFLTASQSVEVIGTTPDSRYPSGLFSSTQGAGDAGNLRITTGKLIVRNGAEVSSFTAGEGQGGTMEVTASESVEVVGTRPDGSLSSGLYADTEGSGSAGGLTISTGRLIIRDGAQVSTGARLPGPPRELEVTDIGQGANLTVTAESVQVIGSSANGQIPSGLFTRTDAAKDAGDLRITTGRLLIQDGGQVSASTTSEGRGGELQVNAAESIEVVGISADGQNSSGLLASALGGGDAGDLRIETRQLIVRDGAIVSVSSEGQGAAGNLQVVQTGSIRLDNATISATTAAGDRGNITLNAQDVQLRRNSNITTNATGTATGGNITINTDVLAALENSDITARAVGNFGGQVTISAQGIFGTQAKERLTPNSDITASSDLGPQFDGVVDLQIPDVSPTQGLIELPQNLVDVEGLIDRRCSTRNPQQSDFIVTGRGGKPPSPTEPLSINSGWVDTRFSQLASNQATESPKTEIVEATGWIVNAKGQVELVAEAPTANPHRSWYTPPGCDERRNIRQNQ